MRMILIMFFILGCGDKTPHSRLAEPMDWTNDPRGVPGADGPLAMNIGSLPATGASRHRVWLGSWYPFSDGGTIIATTKYDQAVGATASFWERDEANSFSHVSWGGHCNGLAAASSMEREPVRGVSYNGVWFDVDDVKALLVEAWSGGGTVVGGRCNNQSVRRDNYGRIKEDACRDLNPATLHIVLTNFLGRWGKPIILDSDGGEQVWNYPVVSYRALYVQDMTRETASSWFGGYPFNNDAYSMRYVQMEITYSEGTTAVYEYVLELDAHRNIIGGEWFRESQTNHPDFIWRHTAPTVANPYLDINRIYDIYRRST